MQELHPEAFFDLSAFAHRDLFSGCSYVWEALGRLSTYLETHGQSGLEALGCFGQPLPQTVLFWHGTLRREGFEILGGDVAKGRHKVRIDGEETTEAIVLYAGAVLWDARIHFEPGVVVEPGALIKGPTLIGAHTDVRQGAYVRGKCLIGSRCVVGHTTEMKSTVMLDDAKAGHFAYLGDSILGNDTNLGAGTKLANLKIRGSVVQVQVGDQRIDTGLRKFGAILGDRVEIGCNAVTNPGTLLGKGSMVLPVASVPAGYHPPKSRVRSHG